MLSSSMLPSVLVLGSCLAMASSFPSNFATNPFFGSSPNMMELDFPINSKFYSALNDNLNPLGGASGSLVSQNRKYLAKTPAHDHHFATILQQQEEATIKSPMQAAMVASDQLRGQLRNALHTNDDDIYEVESAPVMKAAPYHQNRGFLQDEPRRPSYSKPRDLELPISLSFESNIDHGYEHKQPQKRHRPYSQYSPSGSQSMYQQSNYGGGAMSSTQNLNLAIGLAQDESSSYQKPTQAYSANSAMNNGGQYGNGRQPSAQHYAAPSTSVQYRQQTQRPMMSYQSNSGANGAPTRTYQRHQPQHPMPESTYRTPKYTSNNKAPTGASFNSGGGSQTNPSMESSWLDMGAYSSGKGAFGWYSDIPVGQHKATK